MKIKFQKKCLVGTLFLLYLLTSLWSFQSLESIQSSGSWISETFSNEPPSSSLEDLSSVDYFACCGLGHRLIRMSMAYYEAKLRNFTLRAFWGWCGEQQPVEVYSYLFRPSTYQEVKHVTSRNVILPFYNEIPGYHALVRQPTPNSTECACHQDKVASDLELFTSLRSRFRDSKRVSDFVETQFTGKTVIGIHVRAGNGEGGDFEKKGRNIDDPKQWVANVCVLLKSFFVKHESMSTKEEPLPPLAVYVATDTPSIIQLFRDQLSASSIPVLDLPVSSRREEGGGVLFGESDKVHNKVAGGKDDFSDCLQGWSDTLADMFMLSHADIVIAGKPSSFSQTLPMSLAFGKPPATRKVPEVYCEIVPKFGQHVGSNSSNVTEVVSREMEEMSPALECFETHYDWCCESSTWLKFKHTGPAGHTRIFSKEFVKFLPPEQVGVTRPFQKMRNRTQECLRPRRGRAGGGLKDKCLPHDWLSRRQEG